jgi:S-formylglutathione hydrolase FrmB
MNNLPQHHHSSQRVFKNVFTICSTWLLAFIFPLALPAQTIHVSYDAATLNKTFTGKVYLYLSKDNREPKGGAVGIGSFPCFAIAVKNIRPGQQVIFDDAAVSYPVVLSDMERGEYYVQAVWDLDSGGRAISASPGNIYNKATRIGLTKDRAASFNIHCNEVIKEEPFKETQFIKEEKTASALLSAFNNKPTSINAAVILPKEYYDQPDRRFPVLYKVSGYGGDYHNYSNRLIKSQPIDTTPCITVFLDGNCRLGHSVYTNSDNNGPWGDALTKELIPSIEKKYRCNAARLLTGHSSGGWTVLSLQTQYPSVFTACWSSAPDPVDFRNFQTVDLYTEKNIFYKKDSSLRMGATIAGRIPWGSMKNMYAMENVISRGEQMRSFEAVFSPKYSDGYPKKLVNYQTGAIDSTTVEAWKKYDICLYLRNNWGKLQPDMEGKIRISVGDQDNFLLNYAVRVMEEEMKKLDAKFQFAYYPGDHFTVASKEYINAGNRFLQEQYAAFMNKQ